MKWAEMTPEQRNALIHEKVMGGPDILCTGRFVPADYVGSGRQLCIRCGAKYMYPGPMQHNPLPPPRYSESMDAAMSIIEAKQFFMRIDLEYDKMGFAEQDRRYTCIIHLYGGPIISTNAATMSEAICMAALIACGVED